MTTVVLAIDHHLVRQNLKSLLESRAGFEAVGIRAIHEVSAGRLFLSPPLTDGSLKAYSQAVMDTGSECRITPAPETDSFAA